MVWQMHTGPHDFFSVMPRSIETDCDVVTYATTWNDDLPSRDDNIHASPPNSIRIITMDFRHGFCAAMGRGLVDLLGRVPHDILVMTRCQIQPAARIHKRYVEEFKSQMQYADIKYNTRGNDADVMVATRTNAKHFPHLSEGIQHTVGLPSSTANHQHRNSVLNTSYTSIPLDILVASASADPSQVVQRLAQLRHPRHNRASKHVLLVTAPEWQQHSLPAPYADINPDRYGYDYPLWHTTSVSLFRILAPPTQRLNTDTEQPPSSEERFAALGISMELRVLQLPPKPARLMTPAEWQSLDLSTTQSCVLLDFPQLPTVANRKPTTKPT
jgi:hypothetical protein